jgi:hypothetical protein
MLLHATPLGQLEILRQRFRGDDFGPAFPMQRAG